MREGFEPMGALQPHRFSRPLAYDHLHTAPKVGGAGLAPAVFLMSRFYRPLPSLLGIPADILTSMGIEPDISGLKGR